jgi:O-antigen/teichoic acid export membrane protein
VNASESHATMPEMTTALTSGRLLARNAAWNLATQCAPMAVAVVTIPVLIAGIGTERFGVLTLSWIILGYFSLFDLGLGRALTKLVAESLGNGRTSIIPPLVWTALGLMFALGLVGAFCVGLIAPWLVRQVLRISGPLQAESLWAFLLMAALLPFVISIAGLRGVMEAHQRFRAINVVKMATGLFTLVGPLLVLPFSQSLVAVVGIITAGKLAAWLLYLILCLRIAPEMRRGFAVRLDVVRPLVCFGGWMTVANIINPIMVQMDRFLIGALLSTAAVAYYTTPYELVTKYWFLSNAVLGVIFPAFATSFVQDKRRTVLIFGRGVKYVFLILFPLVLGTVALAPELLTLWLGVEFARQSTFVLRCLALGVFLNGLAQVPSALLQGVGRPDLTAIVHVIELPFYLVAAWSLIRTRGIEGAAVAWTARTALDLVLFFGTARWVLPGTALTVRHLVGALGLVAPVIAVCTLPTGLAFRASLLLLVLTAAWIVTWRRVLTPEEKAPILDLRASFWNRAEVELRGCMKRSSDTCSARYCVPLRRCEASGRGTQ